MLSFGRHIHRAETIRAFFRFASPIGPVLYTSHRVTTDYCLENADQHIRDYYGLEEELKPRGLLHELTTPLGGEKTVAVLA